MDYNTSMTVFYSKSSGKLQTVCSGIQNFNMFTDDADDLTQIWDYVILPEDKNVIYRPMNYKINLDTKQLEIRPEAVPQYPIASI